MATTQNNFRSICERQGWREITPLEWQQQFGWSISSNGTAFYCKPQKGFSTNKYGIEAWQELFDIISRGVDENPRKEL